MVKTSYKQKFKGKLVMLFLIWPTFIFAQLEMRHDSLKTALQHASGIERIDILTELGHMEVDTSTTIILNYLDEAILLAEKLNQIEKLAFAYRVRGMINNGSGKHAAASADFNKALELHENFEDKKEKAVILTSLGIVYRYQNQFEKAIEVYTESSKINDQLNDTLANAIVYHNIGNLYSVLANNDEALKYYKKAYEISCDANHNYGMAITAMAVARILRDTEQYDSSLSYFNKVKNLLDSLRPNDLEASYHSAVGYLHYKMKNYDKAEQHYKHAESYSLKKNRFHKIITVYLNLGILYADTDRFNDAEKSLHKALEIAEDGEFAEKVGDAHLFLSQLYEKTNDYKKAFDHLSKQNAISDSLFHEDLEARISEIRARYETEKKEKENLKLRSENEIKDLSLSRKNIIIYSLSIGFIIIAGSFTLLYFQYRQKDKAFQVLVKQNVELAKKDLKERETKYAVKKISEEILTTKASEGNEDKSMYIELFSKVEKYFIEEKPYLDNKLSLDDLSKALNTNRSYLSKAINICLNKSFYELLNEYRVKEARLLFMNKQYDHISIEGIGQMVGFASRSTFYNYFNRQFGITPSYFRNTININA